MVHKTNIFKAIAIATLAIASAHASEQSPQQQQKQQEFSFSNSAGHFVAGGCLGKGIASTVASIAQRNPRGVVSGLGLTAAAGALSWYTDAASTYPTVFSNDMFPAYQHQLRIKKNKPADMCSHAAMCAMQLQAQKVVGDTVFNTILSPFDVRSVIKREYTALVPKVPKALYPAHKLHVHRPHQKKDKSFDGYNAFFDDIARLTQARSASRQLFLG